MARLRVHTTVERWSNAEGSGVLTATAETPGGIFAPFFSIQMEGFKTLRPGQEVEAIVDEREQDGYQYFASVVRPVG